MSIARKAILALVRGLFAHAPHLRLHHPSKRLVHHAIGQFIGLILVLTGSSLALNAGDILAAIHHWTGLHIPHPVFDGFSYTVHAFGATPFLSHGAKFWRLLLFEVES